MRNMCEGVSIPIVLSEILLKLLWRVLGSSLEQSHERIRSRICVDYVITRDQKVLPPQDSCLAPFGTFSLALVFVPIAEWNI